MKKWLLILLSVFTACGGKGGQQAVNDWFQPNEKFKVLCTTGFLADLVAQIGGERIDVLSLIAPGLDPHTYQLVKGDSEKLTFAHRVFYVGLGLEHGASLRAWLEDHTQAVGVGQQLFFRQPELFLHHDGQLDPHIWMDVSLWRRLIPFIVDELSTLDPEHAKKYAVSGKQLSKQLGELHDELYKQLQAIPEEKRYLITSHDAFNYFAKSYLAIPTEQKSGKWRERFAAPEGLAPDGQLSVSDIQLILRHIQEKRIAVVFPESNLNRDSLFKIISAALEMKIPLRMSSKPLYGDSLGAPGTLGETYQKMMRFNATTIVEEINAS
ncbi:MAG: zinc ABC transporter substrate-binding protein [Chlamydiia bacterium]|nr:zinc ABC transporter substrate-binding protein [Chlamydiia bacterium]